MNIRHGGAIALMGWNLMVPPPLSHSPKNGQIVPLSQWTKAGAFQSEESCDAKRAVLSKLDPAGRQPRASGGTGVRRTCVATKESRLEQ